MRPTRIRIAAVAPFNGPVLDLSKGNQKRKIIFGSEFYSLEDG